MKKLTRMIIYSTGIIFCFCCCGVMQERMFAESWGQNKRDGSFTYCVTFICIQCLINYFYSALLQNTVIYQGENKTNSLYYWTCAITNLSAMICSNMSLDWINYPVQVLGKSCKPISVMFMSALIGNKPYPLHKYVFVFILILGVILFMSDHNYTNNISQSLTGEFLIIFSLVMDGFTAAIQDKMVKKHNTKALHMMAGINKSSVICIILIIVIVGNMFSFINLLVEHPKVIWDIFMYSVVNAQGQVFMFMTVEHFGGLFTSIVSTTRKVFTIFGSVFFFGHQLLCKQWIGIIIVLLALLLDNIWRSYWNKVISSIFIYIIRKPFITKKPKYFLNCHGSWV